MEATKENVLNVVHNPENYPFMDISIWSAELLDEEKYKSSLIKPFIISIGYSKYFSYNIPGTSTVYGSNIIKIESLPNKIVDFKCIWDIESEDKLKTNVTVSLEYTPKTKTFDMLSNVITSPETLVFNLNDQLTKLAEIG